MIKKIRSWLLVGAGAMAAAEPAAKAQAAEPKAEAGEVPGKKIEGGSVIKPDAQAEIVKMLKSPNDIKWNERYPKRVREDMMPEITEKYSIVSQEYQLLSLNVIKEPGKLNALRERFLKHYQEYVKMLKDIEEGVFQAEDAKSQK